MFLLPSGAVAARHSGTLRLDEGFRLLGSLEGPGSARIAGEVSGPVRLGGSLRLVQAGRVDGEVCARHVEVASRASLQGVVRAARVQVAPGGRLRGTLWIEDERREA